MALIERVRTVSGDGPRMPHPDRPYIWRDPARCSPARLAELAEHDAHIRRLEILWGAHYSSELIRRAGL